jgi:hypothetical protein
LRIKTTGIITIIMVAVQPQQQQLAEVQLHQQPQQVVQPPQQQQLAEVQLHQQPQQVVQPPQQPQQQEDDQ